MPSSPGGGQQIAASNGEALCDESASRRDRGVEGSQGARIVEMRDTGHWPHEEAPDEALRQPRGFLAERSPLPVRNAT